MAEPIPPLARSIYAAAEDADVRRVLDELTRLVADEPDWGERVSLLVGALHMLAIHLDQALEAEEETPEAAGADPDRGGQESELVFQAAMPAFVGAVLERLAEPSVDSVQQAAIYALSGHSEHQEAAITWLQRNGRRMRAFRRFLDDHEAYRELFENAVAFHLDDVSE